MPSTVTRLRGSATELLAAGTLAVGTPLLRAAILAPRGGSSFRRRTLALAATWAAGGAATGQLRPELWRVRDRDELTERVLRPAATAAGTVAVFAAGALVVSRVPVLRREIETVIAHATRGSFVQAAALAFLTGVTEEVFFRGTLHELATARGLPEPATTTAAYAVTTCATGNPLLVLASAILGGLAGLERRRTGSVLAPAVLHLGWSVGMVTVLPRVLARYDDADADAEMKEL